MNNNNLQQYKDIDLNKKGIPNTNDNNIVNTANVNNNSIGENITDNSNIIPPEDISYNPFSVHTIRTIEISNSEITNDKDSVICKVCGRKLKDHHSRALGMGPQCYKQFKASKRKMFNLLSRRGG